MNARHRFLPVAASVMAGFVGAGLLDALVTMARATGPVAPGSLLALALGLYGAAGGVAALLLGGLVAGVLGAIPGGAAGLRDDERRDRAVAAGIVAAAAGLAIVAVIAALGQKVLVRPMQSERLATIAAAGLVLLAAPFAGAVAIALYPLLARHLAPRLPRPRLTGTTGLLLGAALGAGLLAAVAAFSRADWRVLDLSPFVALALAAVLGVGHGLFWYRSTAGSRLGDRVPGVVRHVVVALLFGALVVAYRLPETSPALHAADEGSLGLRLGLRLARAASDGDGDGFSARFGGGDCDDHRADVYPGAEEVPGNGVDENCEGGDAPAIADAEPAGAGADDVAPTAGAGGAAGSASPPRGPTPQAAAGGAAGTAGPASPASPASPFRGNILIITIDALRADRLGVAGYHRPRGRSLTPNLDALAARGAYFRRTWSQAPNTPRSFPSILTSRYPSSIRWDQPKLNYPTVLPANHTFFEDLAAAGLTPIGIFSHFYFTPDRGISKSFKEWSNDGAGTIAESNKDSASPRIVPRVIARLRKAAASRERFVLWTHLFEPHSSYMAHKEFPPSGESGVPGLMEKYDYEIAFVDLWVGKLLKALDDLHLSERTAIVVMADHGEAWNEHKVLFHGQDLFDEQLRIPLIIAVPGRPALVSDDPVAAVDLGPTLVDLVGAPVSPSFRGRSLVPRLGGRELPPSPIFGELMYNHAWPHHAAMMIDDGKKLIHRISDRRWELYDLARDPGEKRNLADDPASRALLDRLRPKLLSFEETKR